MIPSTRRPVRAGRGWAPADRGYSTAMNETRDSASAAAYDEWWLATLGRTVVWARLRIRPGGTAEVFDSDGNTLPYDSEDSARAALLDAEFVGYDGLDQDDALARGFSLDELSPPQAEDDARLRPLMVRRLAAGNA